MAVVVLSPSKVQFDCPVGNTILEAALTAKKIIPHGCKDGACGSCKSLLIHGDVMQPADLAGISKEERDQGYILTCVSKPSSQIEICSDYFPELTDIAELVLPCKVEKLSFPSNDIAVLILRLPPSSSLVYLAGQYIDLIFKSDRRSYSIANVDAGNQTIELHIRKVEKGLFSDLVFSALKVGSLLRLNGPKGTFFIRESKAPIIFLAGGTGFAPVKAMVEQLIQQHSKRVVHIYWGAEQEHHLYSAIPDFWQHEYDNVSYTPVLSGKSAKASVRQGYVHQAVLDDIDDLSGYHVYACGSPAMIQAAQQAFIAKGLSKECFFSDAFTPFIQTIET